MRGSGGGARWRRRWREGGGGSSRAAAATMVSSWPGQGVATVAAAATATTVGLLPRPSVSSHSRGKKLLSFLR